MTKIIIKGKIMGFGEEKNMFTQKEGLFDAEKSTFEAEKKVFKRKSFNETLKSVFIVILILFEFGVIGYYLVKFEVIETDSFAKDKIAVVNFNKMVTSKYVQKTMDNIDKILDDSDYKEILFIMNSPGGSPTASEELSQYLKNITKIKKVTMYVEGYALSGGYYIASAIKPINANPNALVGSIGVIMQYFNVKEMAKKWGVKQVAITKGKFKQPFSPFKNLDPYMRAYLDKNMLEPMYQNFLEAVAVNRGKDKKLMAKYAEGKIFIANSKEISGILVDKITSLYAIRKTMKTKHGKDISFVTINKEKPSLGLFKTKVDLNLGSTDSSKISY